MQDKEAGELERPGYQLGGYYIIQTCDNEKLSQSSAIEIDIRDAENNKYSLKKLWKVNELKNSDLEGSLEAIFSYNPEILLLLEHFPRYETQHNTVNSNIAKFSFCYMKSLLNFVQISHFCSPPNSLPTKFFS